MLGSVVVFSLPVESGKRVALSSCVVVTVVCCSGSVG